MSKADLIKIPGAVIGVKGPGLLEVDISRGETVMARICGKMLLYKIRVEVGDKVLVALSPYDTSHGLILWREK